MSLFNILDFQPDQEDVNAVIKELSQTCNSCHLALIHSMNKGIIYKGNSQAKIAIVAEAPGDTETERGIPLIGRSGQEFERWMKYLKLNIKQDLFITNVIQCQPSKELKEGRLQQKSPSQDEITACFGPRTMRILKAMPNLEVVITMGWVAAKALLGGDPGIKTHDGQWFESSLLPGKAIFCMVHPAHILRQLDNNPEARRPVERILDYFKNEYLSGAKDIYSLAQEIKKKRENEGLIHS